MKFRVNKGQSVPQLVTGEGTAVRVVHTEGAILEGPPFWVQEFSGRMTPVDDDGNPLVAEELAVVSVDLPTAKAHERISVIEEMIRRNPAVADALQPELEKAQAEAEQAQADFAERQAARQKPKPEPIRRVSAPAPEVKPAS